VFGVAIAVFFGISTSYWIGTLAYLASTTALVFIVRRQTREVAAAAPRDDGAPVSA
jgi:hypothetical protein